MNRRVLDVAKFYPWSWLRRDLPVLWKEVPGYEGAYSISSRGFVFSHQRSRNHHSGIRRQVGDGDKVLWIRQAKRTHEPTVQLHQPTTNICTEHRLRDLYEECFGCSKSSTATLPATVD